MAMSRYQKTRGSYQQKILSTENIIGPPIEMGKDTKDYAMKEWNKFGRYDL